MERIDLKTEFKNFEKIGDFIYYEGPLESLFKYNDDYYILTWYDSNDMFNEWVVFRTKIETLKKYIDSKISMIEMFSEYKEDCYILSIDNDLKIGDVSNEDKSEIHMSDEKIIIEEVDEIVLNHINKEIRLKKIERIVE